MLGNISNLRQQNYFAAVNLFLYLCIQSTLAITTGKLHIDQLKSHFKGHKVFETRDLFAFYSNIEPSAKASTVSWRVYNLVQKGIVNRTGRGKFTFEEGWHYAPEITPKLKTLHSKLKKQFPFLTFCIWSTAVFNEFMTHQPGKFFVLVEVEKESTESVFFFLKDNKIASFLEPSKEILDRYLPDEQETIIVKSLVTEAPLLNIDGFPTASIEKMLVDIFCDDLLFSAQQGSEMKTIFKEAFQKYTINEQKMLRYAGRRRKKNELVHYLNNNSNLRQQI